MIGPPRGGILSLATGVPPHAATQEEMLRFMQRLFAHNLSATESRRWQPRLRALYGRSGIQKRHSVLADFTADDLAACELQPHLLRGSGSASTAKRMEIYERECVGMAAPIARRAIDKASIDAAQITHLVFCSCTGFYSPGPDLDLIEALDLRPSVQRTVVGFMGCHGGFNSLRLCDQVVAAHPDAKILLICVELCTLHMQPEPTKSSVLSNCLFADGCAALIYGRPADRDARAVLVASASAVAPTSRQAMAWHIGDAGFRMTLSAEVPERLMGELAGFSHHLLDLAAVNRGQRCRWAIHPGGPRILKAARHALALEADDIAASTGVLRDYGNMSSPTIFFVLERLLAEERENRTTSPVVMLGFGPGLTIEGVVLSSP